VDPSIIVAFLTGGTGRIAYLAVAFITPAKNAYPAMGAVSKPR
jgi:hypothetical protein